MVGGGHITSELLRSDLGLTEPEPVNGNSVPNANGSKEGPNRSGFKAAMDFAEKQLLVEALDSSGGNKTAAAQALGMKPSTFRDKLAKHGLS